MRQYSPKCSSYATIFTKMFIICDKIHQNVHHMRQNSSKCSSHEKKFTKMFIINAAKFTKMFIICDKIHQNVHHKCSKIHQNVHHMQHNSPKCSSFFSPVPLCVPALEYWWTEHVNKKIYTAGSMVDSYTVEGHQRQSEDLNQ